jgi:hypothetical protein
VKVDLVVNDNDDSKPMTDQEVLDDAKYIDWTEADKQKLRNLCNAYMRDNKSFNFDHIAALMDNKSTRDCSRQYFLDHQEEEECPKAQSSKRLPRKIQVFKYCNFATIYTNMFLTDY